MKNRLVAIIFLASIALVVIGLFLRGGWIERDTYAFFSYFCQGGIHINIPPFSEYVFSQLSCKIGSWFIFQGVIWLSNIGMIFLALKRFTKVPPFALGILGFCFSFTYSIMSLEDDFLAFGMIFYSTLWLFHRITWGKRIAYAILTILISEFIWKGAALPMVIFLLGSIHPIGALIPTAIYIFQNGLDTWGGSTEATPGVSLITLVPFILIQILCQREKFWEFYRKDKGFFIAGLSLLLLGAFQAKWGLYSIIFLPLLLWNTFSEKWKKIILTSGLIFLLIVPISLALTKPPQEKHWAIIKQAIAYQSGGATVNVHFGVRWLFQFAGGKATEDNYYHSPSSRAVSFWLGPDDKNCLTVSSADDLFFQYCFPTKVNV